MRILEALSRIKGFTLKNLPMKSRIYGKIHYSILYVRWKSLVPLSEKESSHSPFFYENRARKPTTLVVG